MNRTSPALACRFGVVFVLSVLLLSACGGGGAGAGAEGALPIEIPDLPPIDTGLLLVPNTDSYSPMFTGEDGQDLPTLNWVYRVNDGQPLPVATENGPADLAFPEPMVVSFDPVAGVKLTNLPFHFSAIVPGRPEPVTGLGAAGIVETVDRSAGYAQVLERITTLDMAEEAESPAFSFLARSELRYGLPLRWLPDCGDLSSQPSAGENDPTPPREASLSGSTACQEEGALPLAEEFACLPETPNQWLVTGVFSELTVQGRVFRDVVAVDLLTVVPDLGDPGGPTREDTRIVRMWFARGVGMIRAEGAFLFWGNPVDVDLIDILR